ncbi:unnamed protein product [Adineta steineri]|uniref:Metalloendopeptidase n=1 Tax=Adineta steineri TaxID=433720 RepID=A0A814JFY5_9BILA|nr:unnamed protein product [Adineta steineri]CAF3928722.1 unnamed protein product [Adineta steineri]
MLNTFYLLLCCFILSCIAFRCDNPVRKRGDIGTLKKWPDNTIPYEIDSVYSSGDVDLIKSSLAELSTKSGNCVKFVPRTSEHVVWVRVVSLDGCYSDVGLAVETGLQQLSLDRSGCMTIDTIQHEFLHALGFPHEQTRLERDTYVKVLYENIQPNKKHNFDKDPQGSILSFGLPYDFNSIMHYTSDSFSTNGLPVMVPASQNDKSWRYTMGAGNKLTETDLYKVKKVYGCIA